MDLSRIRMKPIYSVTCGETVVKLKPRCPVMMSPRAQILQRLKHESAEAQSHPVRTEATQLNPTCVERPLVSPVKQPRSLLEQIRSPVKQPRSLLQQIRSPVKQPRSLLQQIRSPVKALTERVLVGDGDGTHHGHPSDASHIVDFIAVKSNGHKTKVSIENGCDSIGDELVNGAPGQYEVNGALRKEEFNGALSDVEVNSALSDEEVNSALVDVEVNSALSCVAVNGALSDEDLDGAISDEELNGAISDEELNGSLSDVEVNGALSDGEVNGALSDGEVNGALSDEELNGSLSDVEVNGALSDGEVNGAPSDGEMNGALSDEEVNDAPKDEGRIAEVINNGLVTETDSEYKEAAIPVRMLRSSSRRSQIVSDSSTAHEAVSSDMNQTKSSVGNKNILNMKPDVSENISGSESVSKDDTHLKQSPSHEFPHDSDEYHDHQTHKNVTKIDKWVVQLYQGGVRVEGHKLIDQDDEFWHSSLIVKCLSPRLLQTTNGSLYRLIGKIDREAMHSEGFQDSLISQFEDGFPCQWLSIMLGRQKTLSPGDKIKRVKSNHRELRDKPSLKVKTNQKALREKPSLNNTLLSASGVSEAGTEEDPLVLNRLPTTRSGRRVIPPLAYWTGQRVMVYQQTQCIHVVPGSQNTLHGELSLSFKSDDKLEKREARAVQRLVRKHKRKNGRSANNSKSDSSSFLSKPSSKDSHLHKPPVTILKPGHRTESHSSGEGTNDPPEAYQQCHTKGKVDPTTKSSKPPSRCILLDKSVDRAKDLKHSLYARAKKASFEKVLDTSSEEERHAVGRRKEKSRRSKPMERKTRKVEIKDDAESVDGSWTEDEISQFKNAYRKVPVSTPMFWNNVSRLMKTRSEEQCKEFYYKSAGEIVPKKRSNSGKQIKDIVTEPGQITGRVGTLKRKRQLRELIQNHQKECDNDVYDSTPYRAMKRIKLPDLPCPSPSAVDDFKTPAATRTKSRTRRESGLDCFQTPHQRPHMSVPVSQKKTPFALLPSMELASSNSRNNVDGYIHRIRKKSRGKQWGVLPQRNVSRKSCNIRTRQVTDEVDPEIFEEQPQMYQDDSDADYYFSD